MTAEELLSRIRKALVIERDTHPVRTEASLIIRARQEGYQQALFDLMLDIENIEKEGKR